MHTMPLTKIRYFGGKLGQELASMGASTAGEVLALPMRELQSRFGASRATFITDALRGVLYEPVKVDY